MAKYVGFKIGTVRERRIISEYYCGGCGWPVTDHDSFCPECGGAFRKRDADTEYNQLKAENAKLRELVVQAHECKTNNGCCEDCYQDEWCCPIERDMEELGIEV